MTLKGYFGWFQENWAKVGVIVSIFLTVYLIAIVLPQNTLLFALLMYTPLYMLHEIDEYIYPGGFAQFLNKNVYKMDAETGMLDSTAVFGINVGVWILFSFYSLWAVTDVIQGAWMPYFFIFQALIHLMLGIVGKRFLNPGMISAWLIHVPWAIWTIWLFVQAGVITNPYWNIEILNGLMGAVVMVFLAVFLLIRYRLRQQHR
jgi:hypothetical protein